MPREFTAFPDGEKTQPGNKDGHTVKKHKFSNQKITQFIICNCFCPQRLDSK